MTDHYKLAENMLEKAQKVYRNSPYETDRYLKRGLIHATLAVADNLAWAFQLADRADEAAAAATAAALATCGNNGCILAPDHDEPCDDGLSPCQCGHPSIQHAERLTLTDPRGVCLTNCGCVAYIPLPVPIS